MGLIERIQPKTNLLLELLNFFDSKKVKKVKNKFPKIEKKKNYFLAFFLGFFLAKKITTTQIKNKKTKKNAHFLAIVVTLIRFVPLEC